jgi:DNA invertase Pin-like site-specific DNA recombinase
MSTLKGRELLTRPGPRAAIYARISLDKVGEAAGVGRQTEGCTNLAALEGWNVEHVLIDNDLSAYSGAHRPEYEQLLDLVRRDQIDVIVAYHPDRLYRRLADLVELIKVVANAGVEIRTVAAGHVDLNTASGRFTAQVLGAAAEHESARIGERVSMKHRQNAVLGNAHGGPRMYGYRRVARGRIEVIPEEAAVLREAAERVLRGESFASIVIGLNERGIPSALGRKWRPGSLSMVLKSGRIAGLHESKGVIVGDAQWEPILDLKTWEQVRARITHAPIGRRPKVNLKVNLLAGMCRCAECGAVMAAVSERPDKPLRPGQRPPRRTLACDKANRHGCGSNTVEADYVEQIVVDYGTRRINRTQFLAAQDPIQQRLAVARKKFDRLITDPDVDTAAFEGVTAETWDNLGLDQQRALVRLFIDHVVIRKGKQGRTFDSNRVRPA